MKTKFSKEARQILDSQDRVLSGYDEMIRRKQAEMLERAKQREADKEVSGESEENEKK